MSREPIILVLDQGTTSTRAIAYDSGFAEIAVHAEPVAQHYPAPGRVEHDALDIWRGARTCLREVGETAGARRRVDALGITNQRETTIIWDRQSGRPIHNAIVWQDRRTGDQCARLKAEGLEARIQEKTGLLLDPYFSATKIAWILDHVSGARARAERGELCFGTVDSWLLWQLTGGEVHASDATNASRTLLMNIATGTWDPELLDWFDIPEALLGRITDCRGDLGVCSEAFTGARVPILAMAGDQQAASFAQACFAPGDTKATFGTGCFVMANTGKKKVMSKNRLLSTIATQFEGRRTYALEGSIFMAGAIVQWLRDQLGILDDAAASEAMARAADPHSGVVLVPAFTGLGAPHWKADARAIIAGLTRGAGAGEIVRAALEAVGFQTRDLMRALKADLAAAGVAQPKRLRVDGGMARNDWVLQFLADQIAIPVERSAAIETTALGAGLMAGLEAGVCGSLDEIAARWRGSGVFEPSMSAEERDGRYGAWGDAVAMLTRPAGDGAAGQARVPRRST